MHGPQVGAEMNNPSAAAFVPWTAEEDARLRDLWNGGHTCSEIGALMGRTKSAIIGRAHRQSLPKRASPIKIAAPRDHAFEARQREAVMTAHREGVVDAGTISKNTGVPRKRVVAILNRSGVKLGRVGPAPKKDKISARLTQWKAAGTPMPPAEMFNHDIDPATLVAGVGGSRRHCQFIPHAPQGAQTLYCGKPPLTGAAYCEHHMRLCYRPHPLQVARQGQPE